MLLTTTFLLLVATCSGFGAHRVNGARYRSSSPSSLRAGLFDGFADAMKGAFANDEDLSAIDDGRAPARAQAPRAAVGAAGGGGDDGARRLLDEIAEAAVARPRWTLEVLS